MADVSNVFAPPPPPVTDAEAAERGKQLTPVKTRLEAALPPKGSGFRRVFAKLRFALRKDLTDEERKELGTAALAVGVVRQVDAYRIDNREATFFGGIITLLLLPACAIFIYLLLEGQQRVGLTTRNEVHWTSMAYEPFAAKLRCDTPGGCLVSNEYRHPTAQKVPKAEAACTKLAPNETLDVSLVYAFLPTDGLSILTPTSDDKGEPAFSFFQQMYDTANNEVLEFWAPALPGAVSAWYVHTQNKTMRGKGRERHEYFLTQLSLDGQQLRGSSQCLSAAGVTPTSHQQSRIRMSPQYNEIDVTREGSETSVLFGSTLGTFAAFLAWGGGIVALVDSLNAMRKRDLHGGLSGIPCFG